MKFSLLLSTGLFATSIVAAPRGRGLAHRVASRTSRTGLPAQILDPLDRILAGQDGNATHVSYSNNWSGAVLTAPPAGTTFSAVSGKFAVPVPSTPKGGPDASHSASIWAGIDGDTFQNSILQAGIDVTVTKSGAAEAVTYSAWYEWYPNYAINIASTAFSFKEKDVISISITSSSSTKGTIVLSNINTGKSFSKTLEAPSAAAALGGQNAEWIVEDYSQNGALVPFANFGTVHFSECVAKAGTTNVGTKGAEIINLKVKDTGKVLTDVTIPSESEVHVVYTA
ncbi:uncharacterized protein BP5553_02317 [Venustampulla echinocandica]|uniref:Uncharacterized protein n=1 Tax=Venustampulla echinocandica TaxID=2656787 RepID=A0A370U3J7_9HELO|nr:uncharacterized protein BP5553_02317 [Venustampulla echinocandica]RDL42338.1 hypothetical protein BP5553_02317 [Venustampulla echinocandica]